jgi:hypothetical protein
MNFNCTPPFINFNRERAINKDTIRGKIEKNRTIRTAGMINTAGACLSNFSSKEIFGFMFN